MGNVNMPEPINRNICFRGLTKTGIWEYGYYSHDVYRNDYGAIIKDVHVIINYDEYEEEQCLEISRKTLGQFTGLIDKNGKEIYEGDIVEKNKTFAVIRYCDQNAAFYTKARGFNFYFGWDISQKEISVVGNIHENSDLLS